jgi:hypothetical protein
VEGALDLCSQRSWFAQRCRMKRQSADDDSTATVPRRKLGHLGSTCCAFAEVSRLNARGMQTSCAQVPEHWTWHMLSVTISQGGRLARSRCCRKQNLLKIDPHCCEHAREDGRHGGFRSCGRDVYSHRKSCLASPRIPLRPEYKVRLEGRAAVWPCTCGHTTPGIPVSPRQYGVRVPRKPPIGRAACARCLARSRGGANSSSGAVRGAFEQTRFEA